MSDLIKVTGLWQSTDNNGNMVLSGGTGSELRFVVFKNTFKEKENEPDYNLYVTKRDRQE